ncbi:PP2C family protein-serine/threonine phosphatase [Streptomyces sp. NPDC049879]|uniref:PP2C family protein-serine/threonine phosphatase n=1 Tax=Streptomyces sp. NPDC049879 TaxID=3365598 RepID=UPI0037BA73E9
MRSYAAAQLTGTRSHQCDATAVRSAPGGTRAYVLLDGIGDDPDVREWTRAAAVRVAGAAARRGNAEAGLRAVYDAYAADPDRQDPFRRDSMPSAVAVVAVVVPGQRITIAWCGDARAYILTPRGVLRCCTRDHNMRRVARGRRNVVTSFLGSDQSDEEVRDVYGHRAIETASHPAEPCRLLLASDGAYDPLADSVRPIAQYLTGTPRTAANRLVTEAVSVSQLLCLRHGEAPYADNATALVADLRP